MSDKLKYDVVVVGAGPAGLSAAIILAKAGVKVIVIERGKFPGAKNVMGGVFYTDCMKGIVDEFPGKAPVERHIIEQRMWILDEKSSVGFNHKNDRFNEEPYNCHTVFRARFDKWLADEAEKAGALIINNTVVREAILEDGKVVGVKTDRPQGDVYANAVIVADGVNSLLAKSLGMRQNIQKDAVAVAVKEVIGLDEKVINDRFNVKANEGVTIEMTGNFFNGEAMAFLYTNQKSVSLGVGMVIADLVKNKLNPNELIESLKKHPSVAPLIEGGETKEFLVHLIPEGGFHAVPKVAGNGVMLAGDAAMLVDSIHREGSNLAITSGKFAAETYLEAAKKGDFSEKTLSLYAEKLKDSFVLEDLKKYKGLPDMLQKNERLLKKYPKVLNDAAFELLNVNGVSKKDKEKLIWKNMKQEIGLGNMVKDMLKIWRNVI
ncbi:MAG: FAD-dependent oxidoreductase [Bacteroidales bacterium]|nr:FAD-dependent oxidoreductase [Bacteroidales bacterium]